MSTTGAARLLARHQLPLLLLLALTCFYLSLSPGTIEGQGYNKENIDAAAALADNLINAARARPLSPLGWTRHGGVEVWLELPLALVARLLFESPKWPGRLLLLLPVLFTALLATVIFTWASRLTGSRQIGFLLALLAAIGTMLWPYAYIGMETSQSLSLLLAAWVVFGRSKNYSWAESLLLASCCALALALKLNGVFLLPAVGYLLGAYFGAARRNLSPGELGWKAVITGVLIVTIFGLNYQLKSLFWANAAGLGGSSISYFRNTMVDGPFEWALHFCGFFLSLNKSIFLYAPILLPCMLMLPAAWRAHAGLAIFALLVLLGLAGGFALVNVWTEETWGPRYLHAAIAPLILCLAATLNSSDREGAQRKLPGKLRAWLWATAVIGFAVSLLGSLFYYGELSKAAMRARQHTLEDLQYEPAWNHVRFNSLLLGIWVRQQVTGASTPVFWPPQRHWWLERPPGIADTPQTNIRDLAEPAPLLLRPWRPGVAISFRAYQTARLGALLLLCVGLLLLAWVAHACRAADRRLLKADAADVLS